MWIFVFSFFIPALVISLFALCKRYFASLRQPPHSANSPFSRQLTVAFFHLNCGDNGGGEKVLWHIIQAIHKKYNKVGDAAVNCIIYAANRGSLSPHHIIDSARSAFPHLDASIFSAISTAPPSSRSSSTAPPPPSPPLRFVFLRLHWLLEASRYPRLTLLLQSLAGALVALEALLRTPAPIHVFVDTTGFAFSLPVFKWLGGARTAAYVHYPTISADMTQSVAQRRAAFNNADVCARSAVLTRAKLAYYRAFSWLYSVIGRRCCDLCLVNSSWTRNHMTQLWTDYARIVYPPSGGGDDATEDETEEETEEEDEEKEEEKRRQPWIVSIGQFRPEKNHRLQIEAFHEFLQNVRRRRSSKQHDDNDDDDAIESARKKPAYKLILIGGCRHEADRQRLAELQRFAFDQLELSGEQVEFHTNLPRTRLDQLMRRCAIGVHTMANEHFGIGVVECMRAGLITVAHDSGGPRLDIISRGEDGFLAETVTQYAREFERILCECAPRELAGIRARARRKTRRFSDRNFETTFLDAFGEFCEQHFAGKQK